VHVCECVSVCVCVCVSPAAGCSLLSKAAGTGASSGGPGVCPSHFYHLETGQEAQPFFLFFFFFGSFFFSELGTEPRALRFLGKRSTTELNPQPPSLS